MERTILLAVFALLSFVGQHTVDGRDFCIWCNKGMANSFMNCLSDKIISNPQFQGILRDNVNDLKSSMLAASEAMTSASPGSVMKMLTGALAGEITGLVRSVKLSTRQSSEEVTDAIMRMIADCYIAVTGQSHINFIKELGKTVDFMLSEDQSDVDYYDSDIVEKGTVQVRDNFAPEYVSYSQRAAPLYDPPRPVYNPSRPVFNPPPPAYNPPLPVYNPPPPVYNPRPPFYNPPPPVNNPPPPVYNPPPPVNDQSRSVYNPPPPVFNPPPPVYKQPPQVYDTSQPVYNRPPPPVYSSPQVNLPQPMNNWSPKVGNLPPPVNNPLSVNNPPPPMNNPPLPVNYPPPPQVNNPPPEVYNRPSQLNNLSPYQPNRSSDPRVTESFPNQPPFVSIHRSFNLPAEQNKMGMNSFVQRVETEVNQPAHQNSNVQAFTRGFSTANQNNPQKTFGDPVPISRVKENINYPIFSKTNIDQNVQQQGTSSVAVSTVKEVKNLPIVENVKDPDFPMKGNYLSRASAQANAQSEAGRPTFSTTSVATSQSNQQKSGQNVASPSSAFGLQPKGEYAAPNQYTQNLPFKPKDPVEAAPVLSSQRWGKYIPEYLSSSKRVVSPSNVIAPNTVQETAISTTGSDPNPPAANSAAAASAVGSVPIPPSVSKVDITNAGSPNSDTKNNIQTQASSTIDDGKACAIRFGESLFVNLIKSTAFSEILGSGTPKSFTDVLVPEVNKRAVMDSGFGETSAEVEAVSKLYIKELPAGSNSQVYGEKITKAIMVPMYKMGHLEKNCEESAKSIALNILKYFNLILPYLKAKANEVPGQASSSSFTAKSSPNTGSSAVSSAVIGKPQDPPVSAAVASSGTASSAVAFSGRNVKTDDASSAVVQSDADSDYQYDYSDDYDGDYGYTHATSYDNGPSSVDPSVTYSPQFSSTTTSMENSVSDQESLSPTEEDEECDYDEIEDPVQPTYIKQTHSQSSGVSYNQGLVPNQVPVFNQGSGSIPIQRPGQYLRQGPENYQRPDPKVEQAQGTGLGFPPVQISVALQSTKPGQAAGPTSFQKSSLLPSQGLLGNSNQQSRINPTNPQQNREYVTSVNQNINRDLAPVSSQILTNADEEEECEDYPEDIDQETIRSNEPQVFAETNSNAQQPDPNPIINSGIGSRKFQIPFQSQPAEQSLGPVPFQGPITEKVTGPIIDPKQSPVPAQGPRPSENHSVSQSFAKTKSNVQQFDPKPVITPAVRPVQIPVQSSATSQALDSVPFQDPVAITEKVIDPIIDPKQNPVPAREPKPTENLSVSQSFAKADSNVQKFDPKPVINPAARPVQSPAANQAPGPVPFQSPVTITAKVTAPVIDPKQSTVPVQEPRPTENLGVSQSVAKANSDMQTSDQKQVINIVARPEQIVFQGPIANPFQDPGKMLEKVQIQSQKPGPRPIENPDQGQVPDSALIQEQRPQLPNLNSKNINEGTAASLLGNMDEEAKIQIAKLMAASLSGITPNGFNYNALTSTMTLVSKDMKKNHPDWSRDKILTMTYLETIIACTQVLQNIATSRPAGIDNRSPTSTASASSSASAGGNNNAVSYGRSNNGEPVINARVMPATDNQQYMRPPQTGPAVAVSSASTTFQRPNFVPFSQGGNTGNFQMSSNRMNNPVLPYSGSPESFKVNQRQFAYNPSVNTFANPSGFVNSLGNARGSMNAGGNQR